MAAGNAINLRVDGVDYPRVRLVTSREAGCVAIGDTHVFKIWKKHAKQQGPQDALEAYKYVKNLTDIEVEMVKINPEEPLLGNLQVDQATLNDVIPPKKKGFALNQDIICLKMEKIPQTSFTRSFQL